MKPRTSKHKWLTPQNYLSLQMWETMGAGSLNQFIAALLFVYLFPMVSILLPFFFGNAVYIFLLRQNFKSIPKDLDEAAMLDGAGPLRILFEVILPQTWPTVITISLLHFLYVE